MSAPSALSSSRHQWGNHWQVVGYRESQFTKADSVLEGMGLYGLEKSERELREKGLAG